MIGADIINIPDPAVCGTALRHFDTYRAAWDLAMDFGTFMLACGLIAGIVIGYYAREHKDRIKEFFRRGNS
ncbi:MAG: hypothetical protein WC683_04800 [bacterium]